MIIVTSGDAFVDIDAYAGCLAYAELLRQQGKEAVAIMSPRVNASIPTYLLQPTDQALYQHPPTADAYVLIDISDKEHFAYFVEQTKITEVIDHHPGFEKYWQSQSYVHTQIEQVGSACTQIFERWQAASRIEYLPIPLAKLLMAGILDNALGFKAQITTDRDHRAYTELQRIINDDSTFIRTYFEACQATIEQDLSRAIKNDIKVLDLSGYGKMKIGQLTIWDSRELLSRSLPDIRKNMGGTEPWLFNLICIKDGRSIFITNDPAIRTYIEDLLSLTFDEANIAPASRLWLRKEIVKKSMERHSC